MLDRIGVLRHRAEEFRPILLSAWLFSPNREAREKCRHLMKRHHHLLGQPSALERFGAYLLTVTAMAERVRHLLWRAAGRETVIRQPSSRRLEYGGRAGSRRAVNRDCASRV